MNNPAICPKCELSFCDCAQPDAESITPEQLIKYLERMCYDIRAEKLFFGEKDMDKITVAVGKVILERKRSENRRRRVKIKEYD